MLFEAQAKYDTYFPFGLQVAEHFSAFPVVVVVVVVTGL